MRRKICIGFLIVAYMYIRLSQINQPVVIPVTPMAVPYQFK